MDVKRVWEVLDWIHFRVGRDQVVGCCEDAMSWSRYETCIYEDVCVSAMGAWRAVEV